MLFGLSHDWRTYARYVLTRSLTVDLAITVSLQRPLACGHPYDPLDSFLSGFPSLQHLTVLAGNGGAPIDDSSILPSKTSYADNNGSSTVLAMAEAGNVALAAARLLRLHPPETKAFPLPNLTSTGVGTQGPRLTSLELRLHSHVWRALQGSDPDDLLDSLVAAHPFLESLSLHLELPTVVTEAAGLARYDRPLAVVSMAPLKVLPRLTRLSVAGPVVVEGLSVLVQLQVRREVEREEEVGERRVHTCTAGEGGG